MTFRLSACALVSMALVALLFALPTGGWTLVVGSEVADTELVQKDYATCEAQPGETCSQKYNECDMEGTLSKVCDAEAGTNGCGSTKYCVARNNDHAHQPGDE